MSKDNGKGGLDIAQAQAVTAAEDDGQVVELMDVEGEPLLYDGKPVTITVAGSYSARFRQAAEKQRRQVLKARRKRLSASDLTERQVDLEASCVMAWSGIVDKGEPVECTHDNAVSLLTSVPWVREQVQAAMEDHAGFFGSA